MIGRARQAWHQTRRFARIAAFGFEILVLSRLLERRRRGLSAITIAALETKGVERLPPEIEVHADGQELDHWRHGFAAVYASLFLNLRAGNALTKLRHAHPGPPFRAIYLWDSAFIAQVWAGWDPQVAWEALLAVVDLRDGDRLQHFASEFQRSHFTQPPLVAWSIAALMRNADASQAREWAERAYPPLKAYHHWLDRNRGLPNGLYAWAHAYESGVENAPRFSSTDERRLEDISNWAAPDFSSYMVLQSEALAELGRRLGREEEAQGFADKAAAIREAMNAHLWDEERGLYFDRDMDTGELVRSHTIASLLPLWAGVPSAAQAERMVQRIAAPEQFASLLPLPSVALDHPGFERDMWRGPVWLNTAFAVVEGLRRYQYHELAAEFAFRLCDGVYRAFEHHGHFYEFYDPTAHRIDALHRKRGNRWKKMTLGSGPVADFVGWTGLVNTMVTEHLFGLHGALSSRAIRPRFPASATGMRFTLDLPEEALRITAEVGPERAVRGRIEGPAHHRAFTAAFGEKVALA